MKTRDIALGAGLIGFLSLLAAPAYGDKPAIEKKPSSYRAYVTLKAYHQEQNGNPKNPESQVRVQITFPDQKKIELPDRNRFWSVKDKQTQDINETFEVPQEFIQNDGFSFEVAIIDKGKEIVPCQIRVNQLSQFNRNYFCRTDVNAQANQQKIQEEKLAKQAVELRVFSDVNSSSKEIPKKLLALKRP